MATLRELLLLLLLTVVSLVFPLCCTLSSCRAALDRRAVHTCHTCDVLARHDLTANQHARAQFMKGKQPLFLTFGSGSMRDFILNWHAQTQKALPGQATLMAALDEGAESVCEEHGFACVSFSKDTRMHTGGTYWRQNEDTFLRMATLKTTFLAAILTAGYDVWMSDLDVVWLSSPWPWSGGSTEAVVPEAQWLAHADVIASTDIIRIEDEKQYPGWLIQRECNTGVIFFRATEQAILLALQWRLRVYEERHVSYKNDQASFNRMFDGGSVSALAPALEPGDRVRGVFRRHGPNLGNATPVFGTVPMDVFLNGHTFFAQKMHKEHGKKPVVVHATYVFSDEPRYSFGKRHRLREMQAWHVDPDEYYAGRFVNLAEATLLDDVAATFDAVPQWNATADNRGTPTGIETHVSWMDVQRARLAKLFVLAHREKTVLILPHFVSFCERHFWLLEKCRVAGNSMSLPRVLPLDHALEIGRMYDAGLEFREADLTKNVRFKGSTVVTMTLSEVDETCLEPGEHGYFEKVVEAMYISVSFCGKEDWYIPEGGVWDPKQQPLNCTRGFGRPVVNECAKREYL